METVKIVFDIDTKDVKTSTDELKALNKVTNEEVASLDKLGSAAKEAGDGFVSLRTQVKQAKEEAQKAADKYGEFSKEANNARQKAGLLADQMGDLNRQVNLLNPEAKAKAFSNLGGAVVGAFSVATGALQAFGVKNKEVEELAMKLQGALNITQGIASFGALKESLADIKIVLGFTTAAQETMTVATEAQAVASTEAAIATKGFTASLLTNPIFLVIAAIAALAGAMIAMGDDTKEAKKEIDLMTESQKALRAATNEAAEASDNLLVAQGKLAKSSADINKANRDNKSSVQDMNEELKKNNIEIIKNNAIIAKENKIIADNIAINKYKNETQAYAITTTAKLTEEYSIAVKKNKELAESNTNIVKSIKAKNQANKDNIETIKAEKKIADTEKQKQDQKQLTDLSKQNAKEREAAWQDEYKLIQLRQKNQVDDASSNEEKLALQQQIAVENFQYELKHLQETGATVTQLQTLWENYYAVRTGLSAQQDKVFQDSCEKQLKAQKDFIDQMAAISDKEKSPTEKIQAENDAIDEKYAKQYEAAVKNGDDTTAITEAYLKAVEAQQKKLTDVIVSEDEKRKKSGMDAAMARYNREKEAMDRTIQATNELFNALSAIQAANYNQETIDAQKQKEAGLISEEEYQKKLKELKHRQDVADKNAAIFKATLDFAAALINALKAPPLAIPAQLAFVAAIAGLNLAKIIATPLPKYQKGTLSVPGMDMGRDSVQAMLQPGEAVIPTATNRAYHPTIKAIYEKKISPSEINNFVMSKTKGSPSSTNMTASIDTYALGRVLGKNKGVQIENANLVGKAIARELGNRFNARQTL